MIDRQERNRYLMKGFKAFKKGLICRDKQYAENTVFEEDNAKICASGMHFCEKPLDVLDYYPLIDDDGNMSEFAEVEALDEVKTDDNKKYCTKKLKIGAKISFPALVQADVNFELERVPKEETSKKTTDERNAQIGSSGDSARIGSSGDFAKITSEGKDSVICCAGYNSIAKGKIGSWITLSEWRYDRDKKRNIPICVKTEFIDGEKNQRRYILSSCER